MNRFLPVSILGVIMTLTTTLTKAQSTQLFSPADSVARLELRYLHPFYDYIDKNKIISGAYDIAFSYPISDNWKLMASIPYGVAKYEIELDYLEYSDPLISNPFDVSKTAWGNLMLGATYCKKLNNSKYLNTQGSIFLPTASHGSNNKALDYMLYGDLSEMHKYLNYVTTIFTKIAYGTIKQTAWNFELGGGLEYMFAGSNATVADDLYLNYSFNGNYSFDQFALSADYTGLINLTTDEYDDFRDQMFDVFSLGAHYSAGNFQPSLFYSVYTRDDIRDVISGTLGIKLAYRFAK